ncbi:MAG: signal peptidase II [Clostridiales bacterium]|nr:signal peptidase II [Clostridiales bacterium]
MFWIYMVLVVAIDRVTKYLVTSNMHEWQSIPVIDGFFHITYVMNDGAAWSILQGQRWFFVIITVMVLAGLLWFLRGVPKSKRLMRFSLALFGGGACGNFIDRLFWGAVTDFFDFRFFPVFNVADSCIVIGVALLTLCVLKSKGVKSTEGEV